MNDNTSFADMINMVYEDYGLDKGYVNFKLSYMLRKKSLMKLTHDTPPEKNWEVSTIARFLPSPKA